MSFDMSFIQRACVVRLAGGGEVNWQLSACYETLKHVLSDVSIEKLQAVLLGDSSPHPRFAKRLSLEKDSTEMC